MKKMNENIAYEEIPEGFTFSTHFPTWIIAFSPATDEWFCTDYRFWFYEYDKEFETYQEGEDYFMTHKEEFFKLRQSMADAVDFYDLHENELYFTNQDFIRIRVM